MEIIRSNCGSVSIYSAFVILCMFILMGSTIEVVKAYTVISSVKTFVSEAVVSTAADNYYSIYTGIRESNSTNDYFDDTNWDTAVLSDDLQNRLKSILVLEENGTTLVNSKNGATKFSINDLSLSFTGVQKQADNSEVLGFEATFEIEIPLSLSGVPLPPLELEQSVSSTFMPMH